MSGGTSPSVDSSSPSPSCHGDQRNAANEGQRLKHTRRPRASREEVERPGSLTFQSSQGSPQMSETMSDVISDAKLVSLNEGRTPRSSVDYDQLLSKAAALLKEKNEREEEVATLRARNDSLLELNRTIREKSVRLHAKAEQEEEFISNMLLKRIQKLKNDKEAIALKYEQEEEFLTNDLTRKLSQVVSKAAEASAGVTLQNERDELAGRAKAEQSCVVDTLLVKIRKLEAEINANHVALEQLRREKVDLENALEHEQEQLFNTLGKRMDQLEAEKRRMQARLDQASVSEDQSPASSNSEVFGCAHEDNGERRSSRAEIEARKLREECSRLRAVIATQKSTITNLQQQMNAQESKYVAGLLAVREKSAETRADIRRARISLEGNLTKCLDACRAFANSQTARESDEDKRIDVLLSRISVPKSGTPTLIPTANNPVVTTLSSAETDASWHDERPLSARSESQGDRMEEGSEAADTDGDTQMDSNFFSCEHLPPQSDELSRFSDEPAKLLTSYPSSISAASNEDSNESTESVSAAMGQFARPALPPNRSPVAKKDY